MALLILALVFTTVGAPFVWLAQRAFARDRAVKQWPRTEGVVTSATLKHWKQRYTDKNTGLHSYGTLYAPAVRYTYTVEGETLEGTRIAAAVDETGLGKVAANRIMETYPPQTRVSVLYDPSDPKSAYLEVRRSIGAIILMAFGSMWIAIGTLLLALHVFL